MYTQKQKETVSLIRTLMRLHGRGPVFNNIYPTGTRTVKCYRERNIQEDIELQDIILETLGKLNIKAKIKLTDSKGSLWAPGPGGFIVKLSK